MLIRMYFFTALAFISCDSLPLGKAEVKEYELILHVLNKRSNTVLRDCEIVIIKQRSNDTTYLKTDTFGDVTIRLNCDSVYWISIRKKNFLTLKINQPPLEICTDEMIEVGLEPSLHIVFFPIISFEENEVTSNTENFNNSVYEIRDLVQGGFMDSVKIIGYRSFEEANEVSKQRAEIVKSKLIQLGVEDKKLIIVDGGTDAFVTRDNKYFPEKTKLGKEYINGLTPDKRRIALFLNRRVEFSW